MGFRHAHHWRADLIADLRAKALRARLHAIYMVDQEAVHKLNAYAEELEARVAELDDEKSTRRETPR